jgi:hypothetical protein
MLDRRDGGARRNGRTCKVKEMIFSEINNAIGLIERFVRALKWWKAKPVTSISPRFVELFEAHGVCRNQIPRVLGHDLMISDFVDDVSLLAKLTEPVLNEACSLFGVRREWLDTAGEKPYAHHSFYKYPEDFQRFIKELKEAHAETELTGYLVVSDEAAPQDQAFLILAEAIAVLGDTTIYRYHVCDTWIFGYWKSRAYLTACVAIAWKHGVHVVGRYADRRELSILAQSRNLPGPILEQLASSGRRWYAEDLALLPNVYLQDVDRETDRFGLISALSLWLQLHDDGWMDTGLKKKVRSAFEAELGTYQAIERP